MDIDKLKNTIQDCNLNFLIGSGLSAPFLSTLTNIEVLLTELQDSGVGEKEKQIISASILGKYFDKVIRKNPLIVDDSSTARNRENVLNNYKDFLLTLNTIVLKRKSTLLNKQVNIFTTNIDVFFEKALELTQLEYNDGFYGRFNPIFNLTNFKKSIFKKSIHYDNTSEIPVFNLLKVHGSLTWKAEKDKILYSNLQGIEELKAKWDAIKSDVIEFDTTNDLSHFESELKSKVYSKAFEEFLDLYDGLAVVNPTKEKFKDSLLNLYYYELLRMLSNELEKENTLLFIMGFSLSDEHIREIVLRAANSNPTLLIKVFAYDADAGKVISENLKRGNSSIRYNNVEIIRPKDGEFFDFKTLNEQIFNVILNTID